MYKVVIILILSVIVTSCSVKVPIRTVENKTIMDHNYDKIAESILRQNISNENFFIQKVEIEVRSDAGVDKMIANVRYNKPGKYLISIRNKTGIEAARIYIGPDTIQVNDRINRKLYCASPNYLSTKYGLTISLLPILFGDYIGKTINRDVSTPCITGIMAIETSSTGVKVDYQIDCDKAKAVSAKGESSLNTTGILLNYSDFYIEGDKYFPGKIEIIDIKPEITISMKLDKIVVPWDGIIEFIPGNRYEIVDLL